MWQSLQDRPGPHSVTILADDPVAVIDIPAWCQLKGAAYERLDSASATDDDSQSTTDIVFRVTFGQGA